MNQLNVSKTRGKKQTFQYGNDSLSITELVEKNEIVNYLEKDGQLTYGSQREKLRKLSRKEGNNLQRLVAEYATQNPPRQQQQVRDTLYGRQRRRANLPKKYTNGRAMFGSEPPPKVSRRPAGVIIINGENLTAR